MEEDFSFSSAYKVHELGICSHGHASGIVDLQLAKWLTGGLLTAMLIVSHTL